ncbi:IS110 family transposase [Candidatus Spongiisocius sp.]|uniref:IS110 family transposase n=1 Tax=Candidatus Spongiisocius sp. TaxID=3101273 RepID=UPI003B5C7CE7
MLDDLTAQASPTLRDAYGIGADSAAELLIIFGDNPERIRSEAAFAKLCGTCPIPASSGQTSRHRLYRGGHRQANAALYRVAIVRMRFHQPTIDYVARRTTEGLTKKTSSAASNGSSPARSTNASWPTTAPGNPPFPPPEPII